MKLRNKESIVFQAKKVKSYFLVSLLLLLVCEGAFLYYLVVSPPSKYIVYGLNLSQISWYLFAAVAGMTVLVLAADSLGTYTLTNQRLTFSGSTYKPIEIELTDIEDLKLHASRWESLMKCKSIAIEYKQKPFPVYFGPLAKDAADHLFALLTERTGDK